MKPLLLTVVLLTALAGCSRSDKVTTPTSPSAPPPATPAPAPAPLVVTSLAIGGNTTLTAIGQTTQLTATGNMSDGTTKDLTTSVQWISTDTSSITVSAGGLLTVIRYGQSYIQARYENKSPAIAVQATPPGTFVFWGRVREPGSSGLAGVRVREESSGVSIVSNKDGEFSFGGLTGARLSFQKEGYEPAALEAKPGVYSDAAMQRVIRISAGASVEVSLAPHDVAYELAGGLRCNPCKMVRVVNAQAGRLQLQATWKEPRAAINLWVNGLVFEGAGPGAPLEVRAEVANDAAGEMLVYVGLKSAADYYAPFSLITTVVK